MNHPEQIVALAAEATSINPRPADAAALLVDAAAMLCVEAEMDPRELVMRLGNSHAQLHAAHEAVNSHGVTAAKRSQ